MSDLEQDVQEITGSEDDGTERGGRSGGDLEAVAVDLDADVIIVWDEVRGEVAGESVTTTAFLDLEPGGTVVDARAVVLSDGRRVGSSDCGK